MSPLYKNEISDFITERPAFIEKQRIAQEREQHYYFTLNDFEELVRQYGAPKILTDISEEIYWTLTNALEG